MRALVQRVARASVAVRGTEVAAIGPGLLVLLGVAEGDDEAICDRLADKVLSLRIFPDEQGRMNESLGPRRPGESAEAGGSAPGHPRELLCVSQFTLLADTRRGNRPSFTGAAAPERAEELYERFCARTGAKQGMFGAYMEVSLVNDGPVTMMLELPVAEGGRG